MLVQHSDVYRCYKLRGACACVDYLAWAGRRTGASTTGSSGGCGRPCSKCHGVGSQQTSKHAARFEPHRKELQERNSACRAPGFASSSHAPRSLPCALHAITRVHNTLDTHAARMRARQRHAHALTQQHALTRQKHHVWFLVSLATGNPLLSHRARNRSAKALAISHCSRATCIIHTLCIPLTIIVATVRRDMMTMSETKANETMKKTENTMDDASECVSARACGTHAPRHMRKHAADRVASTSAKQEPSPRPDGLSKTNARHVATVGGLSP